MATAGRARRCSASAASGRLPAFSLPNSSRRAASHSSRDAVCVIFILTPFLSTTEEPTGPNSSPWGEINGSPRRPAAVIGADHSRIHHDRRCGQALGECTVEFAVGDAFRERIGGAVECDDMHESNPVVQHQRLILDSPRISGSQFAKQVLHQLAVAFRALADTEVLHNLY